MLNVFNYYDNPKDLNKSELINKLELLKNITELSQENGAKEKLAPVLYIIKKSARISYLYARYILKERWIEVEPIICKDSWYSYMYAKHVINGPWKECEPAIMKDPESIFYYTKYILKHRWIEAEPIIKHDNIWWDHYTQDFDTED
jgi:hypothetical protein